MSEMEDPSAMSLDEQLSWLLEGTYFADEGGVALRAGGEADVSGRDAGATEHPAGLRQQMAAELKAKLELSAKLKAKGAVDWPLRVYLGVDPTRESLHIGHMVPVVQLRKFQALHHRVIFLIGDYTATIGDPTDQAKEREALSHERVLELSRFYQDQAFRLLDPTKTEVRYNGEWLAGLRFVELAELMALFPVKQVLAREDFRQRLESGEGLRAHELLYSFMQGYDAFALNCDVQVGGYDQHFNLLAGRVIQEHFAKKLKGQDHPLYAAHPETSRRVKGPHVMLTYPLLDGTDGRKMSKSWGNTIDVLDEPPDMYGKVMRISDAMIPHYIDIAVEARQPEKEERKQAAQGDPMGVKKWIAEHLTALYHGPDAAARAAEHFRRTVQEKQVSEEDVLIAHQEDREYKKIFEAFSKACQLAPLFPSALAELGMKLAELKLYQLPQEAVDAFENARLATLAFKPLQLSSETVEMMKNVGYMAEMMKPFSLPSDISLKLDQMRRLADSLQAYQLPSAALVAIGNSIAQAAQAEKLSLPLETATLIDNARLNAEKAVALSESLAQQVQVLRNPIKMTISELIVALQLAISKSEAKRLIEQGGVKLDGEVVKDPFHVYEHRSGRLLQVGKRKIVKLM